MKSYKEFKEGFVHANHKKLDANNNGKLDANDFKLLRKKKQSTKEDCSMKEDLEEMDLSFIKGAKARGSVADQKAARDALIAKRKETNPNPPALGTSSDKYKLGDYDKKSNRSYSEEVELDEVSIATLDSYRKKSFDEPGFKRQAGRALAFNKLSSHGDSKVKSSEEIDVAKSQIKDLIKPEHHSKYPISKITSMSHGRKIYRDASAAGHLKEEVELEESSCTPMHIKQAIGIANDKRYKGGNMTGAVTAIEKLHAGLSEHPKVKSALRTANESVELDEMNIGKKQPRPDTHHIVDKENKPLSLAAYYDKAKAEKDRDEKHPGAKVITRGPRGKVREEVEELEELSKKTLGSYIKKSIVDAANKTRIAGDPSVKNVPGSGVDKRIDAGEKAVKRERNTEKAINKLTRESIELEEGNFEKNMDIIKSGKLPPHIQAILDKRGAKGNDAIMAKGRAEKLKSIKEMLDEARAKKEPMEVYHTGYSAALQHAEKHLNKQGYDIHPDDWQQHISHGPSKPSEGKTVQLHIPLHKDGVKSKKVAHIQVYNRGNEIPKNNELNMYVN